MYCFVLFCLVLKRSPARSLVDSIHLQRIRAVWFRRPGSQTQRSATPTVQRQHVCPQHAPVQGEHRQARRYYPGTSKLTKNAKVFFLSTLHTLRTIFFLLIAAGKGDEATDNGRVCLQQQVPAGATSRQPAAFWWAVSCQAVPQAKKVRHIYLMVIQEEKKESEEWDQLGPLLRRWHRGVLFGLVQQVILRLAVLQVLRAADHRWGAGLRRRQQSLLGVCVCEHEGRSALCIRLPASPAASLSDSAA